MTGKALQWMKAAWAAVGGAAAYLWGPWDALILALVGLAALDYVTGVIKAAVLHELNSGVGFAGLARKVFVFVLVALAGIVDKLAPAANGAVRAAVILFYVANEGLSILENAGALGLPLPKALKSALGRMREGGEGKNAPAESSSQEQGAK